MRGFGKQSLGNSQHPPTHLASLFVRLLRCRNSYVACYAPISTHGRQTKILRNMGSLFIAPYLTFFPKQSLGDLLRSHFGSLNVYKLLHNTELKVIFS